MQKGIRMLFRYVALVSLALALFFPAGCQESERRNLGSGAPARPIAVVNNERIGLEEFVNTYQLFLTRWDRVIQNDPAKKQEIKEIVLANLIDELLLDQEARRTGLDIGDEEVDAEIVRLSAPYSEEDLTQSAGSGNRSLAEWREEFKRRLTHDRLIKAQVVSRIRVTQREMRAYYERHREQFVVREQVKVRHIAVGSRSEYRKVVSRLRRNEDFVKLVRKYSITPDRERDGNLGFVERGVLPAEFDQAIFQLGSIGSINPTSKPVKTQMGYHLFRLEGRKPGAELTFKEALPLIRKALIERKQPKAFKAWIQNLRDKATIRINKRLLNAEMG
jgi:parvulin-like peptidyl-prolyl isomerase